jgi:uncharacterized membrane protein YqiK
MTILLFLIVIGAFIFFAIIPLFLFIKKIKPGEAGVRTGFGGIRVAKDWMLRVPIFQQLQIMDLSVKKLEVVRKGKDGLICQDNIRADIEVVFYVRVNDEKSEVNGRTGYYDIKTVATQVGCERASEIELLRQLFEAKFSEALKSAAKLMDFEKLYTDRIPFRQEIIYTIGSDLNGYILEDVAIDYLEQTPKENYDPSNVLDAQGIEKIVRITSDLEEISNDRVRQKEMLIKEQDVESAIQITRLEREYEEFLAQTKRQLDDELAKNFPDMESTEEIRSHIWQDHPVWSRLSKLEEDVALLKSNNPPSS